MLLLFFFCSKEDIQVPRTVEKAEKQNFSRTPMTSEKQKRGKPTQAKTRRGRAALKPYQRTRARVRRGSAKLTSDELDNSDESDGGRDDELTEEVPDDSEKIESGEDNEEQQQRRGRAPSKPRQRKRARTGKYAAKPTSDELQNSDESDGRGADNLMEEIRDDLEKNESSKDDKQQELRRASGAENHHRTSKVESVESDVKQENAKKEDRLLEFDARRAESGTKGTGEKLGEMVDPLQAMLLDMIPTLSQKRKETASSSASVTGGEKSQPAPDPNPVKKKVSYKDVAGQLLEDW